jgi:hypothetical protein
MESGPPKIIEAAVEVLLPPACRESVLGDLCERYSSAPRYLREAAVTVPLVIVSRIRRTTDAGLLLLEAFALYLSFVTPARFLNAATFLTGHNAYLRLALPALMALVAVVLTDAYAATEKRMVKAPAAAFCAMWLQFALTRANADWTVPREVMLFGSYAGALMLVGLRALFAWGNNRTTGAG